jgi:hypothetical protein
VDVADRAWLLLEDRRDLGAELGDLSRGENVVDSGLGVLVRLGLGGDGTFAPFFGAAARLGLLLVFFATLPFARLALDPDSPPTIAEAVGVIR